MRSPARPGPWIMALLAILALGGLASAWAIDRASLERANRLYRGGAFAEAATIYADRLAGDPRSDRIRYNLGTALLGLGNDGAGEVLAGIGPAADVELQVRALNNLGLWRLIAAAKVLGQDRARQHAVAAIAAYKAALRLRPGHADSSWNLAIAFRMLASIDAGDYQDGGDPVEGGGERERDAPPNDDPDEASDEEVPQAGPKVGEGETAAADGATTPLSPDRAAEILRTDHRDPTAMVGKLIAAEGRILRQRASGKPDAR